MCIYLMLTILLLLYSDEECGEQINIRNAIVIEYNDEFSGRPFSFEVEHTGKATLNLSSLCVLSCTSRKEQLEWMNAIALAAGTKIEWCKSSVDEIIDFLDILY